MPESAWALDRFSTVLDEVHFFSKRWRERFQNKSDMAKMFSF